MKIILEVGDYVQLPFGERGIIKKIVTDQLDWFPYKIKITKPKFNHVNQTKEFKFEQLEIDPNHININTLKPHLCRCNSLK